MVNTILIFSSFSAETG